MEKRKLTDNISIKIMSVVVGFLIWLIVGNVDNPITRISFTIPVSNVEVLNEAYVDSLGKMCMLDDSQQQIRVQVSGERKTLRRLSANDLVATADLQQAVNLDTDPVMIPLNVTCTGTSAGNIEVNPKNLMVHLREKKTQEFVVSVSSGESKPGKGYEIGTLTASPEKIRITGPSSLINKIGNVSTSVNVEGKTQDFTVETPLRIIDKNGDVFSDSEMKYLNSASSVNVSARFWKVRGNIRIAAEYSGVPEEGYCVDSITTVPDVISLAGSESGLKALEEQKNCIQIPADYIDVTGHKNDIEQKIDVTELLPEGTKLVSSTSEDIWIRVNILPEGSSSYDISTMEIEVKNIPEGMQPAFDTDKIEVRIQADETVTEKLRETEITASIDLKGMEEGSYQIPVEISLPEGYSLIKPAVADIRIVPVSAAETEEE